MIPMPAWDDILLEESLRASGLGSAPAVDDGTVPVIDIGGPEADGCGVTCGKP